MDEKQAIAIVVLIILFIVALVALWCFLVGYGKATGIVIPILLHLRPHQIFV